MTVRRQNTVCSKAISGKMSKLLVLLAKAHNKPRVKITIEHES